MRALLCLSSSLAVLLALSASSSSCSGCDERPASEGEGDVAEGEGDAGEGEGEGDGGDAGEGEGEPSDAGFVVEDGGNPFELPGLFDGGLPEELACLPGTVPDLSVSGILSSLELSNYTGRSEDGVKCGDGVICDPGVPCCVLCGFAACGVPIDGGPVGCPLFTQTVACDGVEDCDDPSADTCCFSLSGADCRPAADCTVDVGGLLDGGVLGNLFRDAGFPDAGFLPDGGVPDAGLIDVDAGPTDAGPSLGDVLQDVLDQGVPVCRNSLFDCDLLRGELCCTSERFVAVDLGLCLPALVCLGN